jgi:RNA polymerase sigma-70 factor (ECF subfamily)
VRLDQVRIDLGRLSIEHRPDRLLPDRAFHGKQVVGRAGSVPDDCKNMFVNGRDPLRPLLDAACEGDDRAVAELVRLTQPSIWRLCESLGSPAEPADLVQETFERALRSMHGFRGEAPVRAWLLSIARHVCADAVRRAQRQRRLVDRISRFVAVDAAVPAADRSLDDLVDRLEGSRREAFVLTQQLGLSYEEAAEVLGCPVGTIRSRVSRARSDLLESVRAAQAG